MNKTTSICADINEIMQIRAEMLGKPEEPTCPKCQSTDIVHDEDCGQDWCNDCEDWTEEKWDKWDWIENDYHKGELL